MNALPKKKPIAEETLKRSAEQRLVRIADEAERGNRSDITHLSDEDFATRLLSK